LLNLIDARLYHVNRLSDNLPAIINILIIESKMFMVTTICDIFYMRSMMQKMWLWMLYLSWGPVSVLDWDNDQLSQFWTETGPQLTCLSSGLRQWSAVSVLDRDNNWLSQFWTETTEFWTETITHCLSWGPLH